MSLEEPHYEIVCECNHLIRYHEKGQFACVVEGCPCTKIEPIEREITEEDKGQIANG